MKPTSHCLHSWSHSSFTELLFSSSSNCTGQSRDASTCKRRVHEPGHRHRLATSRCASRRLHAHSSADNHNDDCCTRLGRYFGDLDAIAIQASLQHHPNIRGHDALHSVPSVCVSVVFLP